MDVCWQCCTRERNIELRVRKNLSTHINSNMLKHLTLRFVDGHCVGQTHWKLLALHLVWNTCFLYCEGYAWNECNLPLVRNRSGYRTRFYYNIEYIIIESKLVGPVSFGH